MTKASKKRSHSELSDEDSEGEEEGEAVSGKKVLTQDLASGTKHDTTQLWFDDITKEDLQKAYGKSGKKTEYDPTETGKHK